MLYIRVSDGVKYCFLSFPDPSISITNYTRNNGEIVQCWEIFTKFFGAKLKDDFILYRDSLNSPCGGCLSTGFDVPPWYYQNRERKIKERWLAGAKNARTPHLKPDSWEVQKMKSTCTFASNVNCNGQWENKIWNTEAVLGRWSGARKDGIPPIDHIFQGTINVYWNCLYWHLCQWNL
jgi:hypothetical protein